MMIYNISVSFLLLEWRAFALSLSDSTMGATPVDSFFELLAGNVKIQEDVSIRDNFRCGRYSPPAW